MRMRRLVWMRLLVLGLGLPFLSSCDESCDTAAASAESGPREACCDADTEPPGIEPAICCADGFWAPSPGGSDPSACDGHEGLCQACGAAE